MPDIPADAGQVSQIATDTLHGVAGLTPGAQIAAMLVVGAVAGLWIWTRRPRDGGDAVAMAEAMKISAQAMTENATAMAAICQQNERIMENVEAVAAEVRGLSGLLLSTYNPVPGAGRQPVAAG